MESPATPSVASQFSLLIEGLLLAIVGYLEALLETPEFQARMAANPGLREQLEALARTLRREALLSRPDFLSSAAPPRSPLGDGACAVANVMATIVGHGPQSACAWAAPARDAGAATLADGDFGGGDFSRRLPGGFSRVVFVAIS